MLAQGEPAPSDDWTNKLIWGDNKYILSSLIQGDPSIGLTPLAGKVDLIYIDPPFNTGQNFSYQARVGDETVEKESSMIEESAYRDTWGKGMESYLQMMYERLVLARELLSPKGSIYLHCDYRVNSHLRLVFDDIFGPQNMRNEIIARRAMKNLQGQFADMRTMNVATDSLFWYTKDEASRFRGAMKAASPTQAKGSWASLYNGADRPTMRYELLGATISRGQWKWRKERAYRAVANYQEYLEYEQQMSLTEWWQANGETLEFVRRRGDAYPQYWVPPREKVLTDTNWCDIAAYSFTTGYSTEKSEQLLSRIIEGFSNSGDLVLDFFAGSGTTMAVAEKLGRRWIGCDLSRYALQVTRKRMLNIDGCRPFQLLNLGRYERQHWQGSVLNGAAGVAEYYRFILGLYHAEAVSGHAHLHGRKGGRMTHVGPVDAPVTRDEVMAAVGECAANRYGALDVLGWEWEQGLHDTVRDEAKAAGVDLRLLIIPREVMDSRAVERGDVCFYELAYLKAVPQVTGMQVAVRLEDFIIPSPDLIPDEVRAKIKRWSDYIDFWAVDWNFGRDGEGDTFHNEWQTYRTRAAPTLRTISDSHPYDKPGNYSVLVKVIDIFGNDTTQLHTVAVA